MTSSNTPARLPERQPESASTRPARSEKKASRFVIKVGGIVPC